MSKLPKMSEKVILVLRMCTERLNLLSFFDCYEHKTIEAPKKRNSTQKERAEKDNSE